MTRLLLGRRLRELREACEMTRADAGNAIGASVSKITRLELGRTSADVHDVARLLAAYGVREESQFAELVTLAEESEGHPWWHSHRDVVPRRDGIYLSAEEAARLVRRFEVGHVPELLRTDAYARELVLREESGRGVERRLELLAQRQRILRRRPRPVNLWVVLEEGALHNSVGDALTMRTQLHHLKEMCWRPNVTVQIASKEVCDLVGADRPVTLVRFQQQELPDLVYLDRNEGSAYPARRGDIEYHWHVFNTLVVEAEAPERTPSIINAILADR